jgi:Aldo/keto reductase family
MEYARLGNTGLMVSELCLGCMTFGQEANEETSREIVGRFLDAGGTFLDTSDVYSNGVSEGITGGTGRGLLQRKPKRCSARRSVGRERSRWARARRRRAARCASGAFDWASLRASSR